MVIAIMLLRERPRAAHMRPSSGDGGIDVITPQPFGPPIVDQIKSFASGALTAGRKKQIGGSLDSVRMELSDQIGGWNLVLPMMLAINESRVLRSTKVAVAGSSSS